MALEKGRSGGPAALSARPAPPVQVGRGERYVQRDGEVEAAIVQRQQLDPGGDGSTGERGAEFVGNVDQRIGEAGGITGGQQLLRVVALAVAAEGGRQGCASCRLLSRV
jgi:hypothetical protein